MATILKQEQLKRSGDAVQLAAFNVDDVQQRARAYLAEVQQQAEQIIAQANSDAAQIREQASQAGFAAGEAEMDERIEARAQQISDTRCKSAIQSCEETVTQLIDETAKWLSTWRNLTVEIASRMAEKVVRREMRDNQETLRVWLEEALVAMRDERDIRVLVHPDDFAVAGRFLQNLAKLIPQAAHTQVIPDPQIRLGGCVVRSANGQFDLQLETQLQRLVDQLK